MDKFKDIIKNKVAVEGFASQSNDAIWEKLDTQIDALEARKRKRKWMYTYAVAASIVLGIMIGFIVIPLKNEPSQVVHQVQNTSTKTDTAHQAPILDPTAPKQIHTSPKQAQVQEIAKNTHYQTFTKEKAYKTLQTKHPEYFELADHSVVALDKDAELIYNDSYLDVRNVKLQGQGYFEVAHNPQHPFTVYFGNTHLVVLGTKFYVRSLPSDSTYRVAVVEGSVKVYNPSEGKYTVLTKGQELAMKQNVKSILSSQISESTTLWKKGTLVFDKSRLKKVFFALNKEHTANIKYDAKISDCIFTGNLSGMSLSDALNLIKMTTNLVAEENNDQIFVTGTKCN